MLYLCHVLRAQFDSFSLLFPQALLGIGVYIMHALQKGDTGTLKILSSMSELGGLWKQHNSQECTQRCQSLHNVEVGHHRIKEGEEEN